jgi:hypothetical protein
MIHLIKGILTKEECNNLTKQFDIDKKISANADKTEYTPNAIGFIPSYIFNTYLDKFKSKVLEIKPHINSLDNVNTYVREYLNKSCLIKHLDRTDISVTMSICLESTINKEWPLCAEIEGKDYCFNTEVGDAILLFDADKTPHWRNILICNNNERVVQFFLHWIPVNYTTKKTKSLL